jgi:hypothetical protein
MTYFSKKWMSYIDGNKKLSELTIPGTHDTCAEDVNKGEVVREFVQTQNKPLNEQLDAGIRFLDIRCVYKKDVKEIRTKNPTPESIFFQTPFTFEFDLIGDDFLAIQHGDYELVGRDGHGLTFGKDVIDACLAFLQENPTESIIMSVKTERGDEKDMERTFIKYLSSQWNENELNWTNFCWYLDPQIPTLNAVRGKIVLLRRFPVTKVWRIAGVGIDAGYWPKNMPFTHTNFDGIHFDIQDEFESYVLGKLDHKFNRYVKPCLERAAANQDSNTLFINFTSGAGGVYPRTLAERYMSEFEGTNSMLLKYLAHRTNVRYGIIPMDFPESSLIDKLIAQNFFHTPQTPISNNTIYELRPRVAFGNCLEVFGNMTADNSEVKIWSSNGGDNQRWRTKNAGDGYYYLHPQNIPDKVLTVKEPSAGGRTNVVIHTKNGNDSQKWKITQLSNGCIVLNPKNASTLALDVWEANTNVGAEVVVTVPTSNDDLAAQWCLVTQNSVRITHYTIYEFRPRLAPGSCLDIWENKKDDNSEVKISGSNNGNNQRWKTIETGEDYYYLLSESAPGKVLAVGEQSADGLIKVVIKTKSDDSRQKWKITQLNGGYFVLSPQNAPTMALDIWQAKTNDGAEVVLVPIQDNDLAIQWSCIRQ